MKDICSTLCQLVVSVDAFCIFCPSRVWFPDVSPGHSAGFKKCNLKRIVKASKTAISSILFWGFMGKKKQHETNNLNQLPVIQKKQQIKISPRFNYGGSWKICFIQLAIKVYVKGTRTSVEDGTIPRAIVHVSMYGKLTLTIPHEYEHRFTNVKFYTLY